MVKTERLTTKITKINGKYHCRLYDKGKVFEELACALKKDIPFCITYMLRWYDKLGGTSTLAKASRNRNALKPQIVTGKIWYPRQLLELKRK